MEPFVHVREYPFVICKTCQFACVTDEVAGHLRRWHDSIQASERAEISQAVQQIPGTIRDQFGLRAFQFPPPSVQPVPFIIPPEPDGLRCAECPFVTRNVRGMQGHCRKAHGWRNEWQKGGNVAIKAKEAREVPWTTGILCQRFFWSRVASGWFEVGRVSEVAAYPAVEASTAVETIEQRVTRVHQAQAARFEAKKKQLVQAGDEKAEPSPWLRRVGWAGHLQGLDQDRLRSSVAAIGEGEPVLQRMWESFRRVMERVRAAAVAGRVGLAVLFEINRKEAHVKPSKPFDSRVEDDTWERYKERTQDWLDAERPPYEFTKQQADLFDRFKETVEEAVEQGADLDQGMVDRLCLDMMVAFLDHPFKDSHYESAIISGLAVMGLRDDGGWARPEDYTPVYSAVIKVARMLVVYQAVLEREDAIAKKEEIMSEEEARAAAPGLFRLVRGKVQRFMTIVTDTSEPAPMDWMFDARTYGMRIRFTTLATGGIDWQGDRITYQRLRFSMGALADMVHELIREMKGVLGALLMVEEDNFNAVPAIDWERFKDDHSEDRVGYSFLQDDRNVWVARGHGWVLGQMLRRADKQAEWVAGAADGAIPYRADAVRGHPFSKLLPTRVHDPTFILAPSSEPMQPMRIA
ncbi:hypothetical protein QBC46DRAFT_461975 [Diplogelasinospora grovesii]|uniref:Uncharacterized protein n=1 Tax=Diplogelasinospora grovesii TaxID=303347 RepID=A0AAN6N1A0_9PEZI|nr:hypothetical protein QBC46DRAFT_461975 [Diplogelasinospora grovesii]